MGAVLSKRSLENHSKNNNVSRRKNIQKARTKVSLTENNNCESNISQRSYLRTACPQQKGYLKIVYQRFEAQRSQHFWDFKLTLSYPSLPLRDERTRPNLTRSPRVVKRDTCMQNSRFAKSQLMVDQPLICIIWSYLRMGFLLSNS